MWNKDKNERNLKKLLKDESHDFLGMITLNINDILAKEKDVVDEWYELQKRSTRSNISGKIRIQYSIEQVLFSLRLNLGF